VINWTSATLMGKQVCNLNIKVTQLRYDTVCTVCYICGVAFANEFFCVDLKSRFLVEKKINHCVCLINYILRKITFGQIRRKIVHMDAEMCKWHVIFL
jgi:hypothetical protein